MNSPLLAEYMSEKWAMDPRALEGFLQTMARVSDLQGIRLGPFGARLASMIRPDVSDAIQARGEGGPFDEAPRRSRLSVAEGVACIGVSGVLLKRVPNVARWFGVESTSYAEIKQDLATAMGDPNVKAIRLKIESPGGMVSGVKETADLIYRARQEKDVTADIQDVGASAAYWLASQADTITANPNASV